MNSSVETVDETTSDVDLTKNPVAEAVNASVVHDKIKAIQDSRIQELMARETELIERIGALAEIPDAHERDRQEATLNATLATVREERIKHQEDVGVLATELFALYDELGMQTTKAGEDTEADIAKRTAAKKVVTDAMEAEATARATWNTAKEDLTEANEAFWPFGKQGRIDIADQAVRDAKQAIIDTETAVAEAEAKVPEVEAQIEIDKRERVRKASLAENFALIRQFTEDAIKALKSDLENTATRVTITEGALGSALTKKRETARELDGVKDQIVTKDRDLQRELNALDEIPDHGSSEYAEQEAIVAGLKNEMSTLKGNELSLNTTHMAMTQAITANESSLLGLRVQHETTEVYIIKLTTAEKTAEVLGKNIDQMVKNTQQEVASDALDRATDSMTAKAVELGVRAEIASAKNRNDAVERHDTLMKNLNETRRTGDQGVAVEAKRYVELDEKIRQGYKDRGVDLEMGHLEAAMRAVSGKPVVETGDGSVEY